MDHTKQKELYREKLTYELYLFSPARRFYTADDVSVERIKIPDDDFSHVDVRARIAPLLLAPHLHSEVKESIASAVRGGREWKFIRHRFVDHPEGNCRTTRLCTHFISSCLSAIPCNWFFCPFTYRFFFFFENDLWTILCFASSVILTFFFLGMNNKLLCWNFENIFNLIIFNEISGEWYVLPFKKKQ